MGTIKILIVDDHKLIRQGIIDFLGTQAEFEVVGEAEDGRQALPLVEKLKPDIVLMDLNMPNMDGIESLKKIKETDINIKVIILTAFTQSEKVTGAIEAGADGYQLKDILPEELIASIHQVLEGKPSVHPQILNQLLLSVSTKSDQTNKISSLSPRELEVLHLLADGRSNEEIAQELSISILTVKTHVHNILSKLDLTKRLQAALLVKDQPELFE